MAKVTVETTVNATLERVWEAWNNPEDICQWYVATDTWHTPHASNDLKIGGKFSTRMEAKDASFGFDFSGTYREIVENKKIAIVLDDQREMSVEFIVRPEGVQIIEIFEAENENPEEIQRAGWQAILDNFKKYVESNAGL